MEISNNELATRLRVAISRLLKIMKREVKHDELFSITERSTLSLISQTPQILPSELARIEKVTSQSMSQIINKLFENGLIRKTPSTKDKRKVFISITPKGQEFIELKRNKTSEWLTKTISEKTSKEEKITLVKAAEILAKLTE